MINWRPIFLVCRREVFERVRSRAFRLASLGILVLAAALVIATDRAPDLLSDGTSTLGVVDETNTPELRQALQRAAEQQDMNLDVIGLAGEAEATEALREGRVDAFLNGGRLAFRMEEDPSLSLAVNRARFELRLPGILDELEISREEASQLLSPEGVQVQLLEPEQEGEGGRRAIATLATIGLYLTLVMYGNWVLLGVVEEKTSRVVEVLLGLLRPSDLLAGKTLGIMVSALIQLSFGVAGALIGLAYVGGVDLPEAAPDVIVATVAYLVPGLVLYCLLYAAVGATISRQSEAQSATMPIAFLLFVPYILGLVVVPEAPDGALATVLSIFPLSSPLIMPTRFALGSPSLPEIALSYGLLLPSIAAGAWLAGRLYANAILVNRAVSITQLPRMLGIR